MQINVAEARKPSESVFWGGEGRGRSFRQTLVSRELDIFAMLI